MSYETVGRGEIETMVRTFYSLVLKDEILSPYFIKALGNNLDNEKWYEHLNTLVRFWLLMMTGERNGYWGDPFPPHAFIGPLYPETFDRWLALFHKVVHDLFVPEIADKFYSKAVKIADQFKENLLDDEDEDD